MNAFPRSVCPLRNRYITAVYTDAHKFEANRSVLKLIVETRIRFKDGGKRIFYVEDLGFGRIKFSNEF